MKPKLHGIAEVLSFNHDIDGSRALVVGFFCFDLKFYEMTFQALLIT